MSKFGERRKPTDSKSWERLLTKRIKYLRVNLTKEVKDLYNENYKTFLNETDDDIRYGKTFHAHGLEE